MNKIIVLVIMIIASSISLSYDLYLGTEAFRTHTYGENYNNKPSMVFGSVRQGNNEVLVFGMKNSQYQNSFGINYNRYAKITDKISLFSGVGIASGYGEVTVANYDINRYVTYEDNQDLMLTDTIMVTVVAGIEYKLSDDMMVDLFVMGTCLDVVFKFKM